MNKMSRNGFYAAAVAVSGLLCVANVSAAEVDVKMLNRGSNGMPAFDPALVRIAAGDSVHFVAADKGHNVESIKGMIPDDAKPFASPMNKDLVVKFDKPGIYGYRCTPHYSMGMVGIVVVGKPTNEAAVKSALTTGVPPFAQKKFTQLLNELDNK